MAVDVKAFLTGAVFLFQGFKLPVKLFRGCGIERIGAVFLIKPFPSVQKAGDEFQNKHGGRIASVLCAYMISAAAFETSGDVIIRIAKDNHSMIAEPARFLKAVFQKKPADSSSLKIRMNADGAEGENDSLVSIFINETGLCIHHVSHNAAVCGFGYQIQLRDEILMLPQNMYHVVLGAARPVHVPEGLSGQHFHGALLLILFPADGDGRFCLLSVFGTED